MLLQNTGRTEHLEGKGTSPLFVCSGCLSQCLAEAIHGLITLFEQKLPPDWKKPQLYFRLKSLLMVNWYSQIPSQNRDCRQAAHFQSKPFFRQMWPEQLIKMYLKFSDFTVWYQFNIWEQGTMGPLLGRALIIFRSPRRTKVWPNFSSVFHPWVIQFQKQFLVPPSSYLQSQLCSSSSSTC